MLRPKGTNYTGSFLQGAPSQQWDIYIYMRCMGTQNKEWHSGNIQSEINIPSSYVEFRERSISKNVAETGSVLTKPVVSFQSPRLHYPALLLFSQRPYDKVLINVSCHIDMPPIKPLLLFFILFLLLQETWKPNAEDGSTVRWMELDPWEHCLEETRGRPHKSNWTVTWEINFYCVKPL